MGAVRLEAGAGAAERRGARAKSRTLLLLVSALVLVLPSLALPSGPAAAGAQQPAPGPLRCAGAPGSPRVCLDDAPAAPSAAGPRSGTRADGVRIALVCGRPAWVPPGLPGLRPTVGDEDLDPLPHWRDYFQNLGEISTIMASVMVSEGSEGVPDGAAAGAEVVPFVVTPDKWHQALRRALAVRPDIVVTCNDHSWGEEGSVGRGTRDAVRQARADGVLVISPTDRMRLTGWAAKSAVNDMPASLPQVLGVAQAWSDGTLRKRPDPLSNWPNWRIELTASSDWVPVLLPVEGGYQPGYAQAGPVAGAHVAAAAAALKAAHPDWGPDELTGQLLATADDIGEPGWDWQTGFGMLDAAEALSAPPVGPVEPPDPPAEAVPMRLSGPRGQQANRVEAVYNRDEIDLSCSAGPWRGSATVRTDSDPMRWRINAFWEPPATGSMPVETRYGKIACTAEYRGKRVGSQVLRPRPRMEVEVSRSGGRKWARVTSGVLDTRYRIWRFDSRSSVRDWRHMGRRTTEGPADRFRVPPGTTRVTVQAVPTDRHDGSDPARWRRGGKG